jgi:hypothetical protein
MLKWDVEGVPNLEKDGAGRDVNESIRFHRIWQPVGSYAATASRLTKYGVLRRSGIL